MFTDMVGSTAAAQANEGEALQLRDEQEELVRPLFAAHQGREVKSMGDGFLAEFDSALRAVQCAIDIQQRLYERNSQTGRSPILLRIGIHLGDVEVRGTDIVGDSVNVASRIEPLAVAGGICLTEPVFGQVRNKVPHSFTKLAPVDLKNVKFPWEVYKVDLPWGEAALRAPSPPSETARRLAVIPHANMSPDPQDEFFADGLTEEIISELSKVPGLRVIARTSVMRFRSTTKGVSEIGKELRVGTVIEGSVRRAGNRIRVTAQLIDTGTEEHLWSERYDRELVDVFAIQTEIAKEVASALHLALPSAPVAPARAPPNLSAYKAYLRGRYLWNRRSNEQVRAALACFEEALRLDPQFAQASSGIADCYSILVDRGSMTADDGGPKAKAAAERAIQLDETNAEAHASLALLLDRNYQWADAEREYRRAIELNPMYASAHQWYYMHLMALGRREKAAGELDRAEEADPLSPIILFHRACHSWITGTDAGALAALNRASELSGDLDFTGFYKLVFYASKSMNTEALELSRRLIAAGNGPYGETTPAMLHAILGQRAEALRELEVLSAAAKDRYIPAFGIAWTYGVLGDADRFFEWLFRSADEQTRSPFEFVTFPLFERMRADPRFPTYLRRCALIE